MAIIAIIYSRESPTNSDLLRQACSGDSMIQSDNTLNATTADGWALVSGGDIH